MDREEADWKSKCRTSPVDWRQIIGKIALLHTTDPKTQMEIAAAITDDPKERNALLKALTTNENTDEALAQRQIEHDLVVKKYQQEQRDREARDLGYRTALALRLNDDAFAVAVIGQEKLEELARLDPVVATNVIKKMNLPDLYEKSSKMVSEWDSVPARVDMGRVEQAFKGETPQDRALRYQITERGWKSGRWMSAWIILQRVPWYCGWPGTTVSRSATRCILNSRHWTRSFEWLLKRKACNAAEPCRIPFLSVRRKIPDSG